MIENGPKFIKIMTITLYKRRLLAYCHFFTDKMVTFDQNLKNSQLSQKNSQLSQKNFKKKENLCRPTLHGGLGETIR